MRCRDRLIHPCNGGPPHSLHRVGRLHVHAVGYSRSGPLYALLADVTGRLSLVDVTEQIQKAKRQKLKRTRDCHVAALVAARIRIDPVVPSRSIAQSITSSLLASATIAIFFRCFIPRLTLLHECASPRRCAGTPSTPPRSTCRASKLGPRRVILPTRFIVPLSNCLGTNPTYALTCRAFLNRCGSSRCTTSASATRGPTPFTCCSRGPAHLTAQ